MKRPYVGIERDLYLEGSPVLLSRTFINEFDIILRPSIDHWWFGVKAFKLMNPYKFTKTSRNAAIIYTLVKMLEEIWLLDEDGNHPYLNVSEILPELEVYLDIFDHKKAGTLL